MVSGLEELGITDDSDEAGVGERPQAERPKAAAPPAPPATEPPSRRQVERILDKVSLFAGLLPVHLTRIARLAVEHEFERNDFVFRHGDEGDGLYIVVEGAIRISRNVSGIGEEALAVLREGAHFGEMSLIDDDVPRSADAIVHERARVIKLPKHDLRDLMFVDRELAYELLWRFVRTLASRLRDSNDRLMMLSVSSRF